MVNREVRAAVVAHSVGAWLAREHGDRTAWLHGPTL